MTEDPIAERIIDDPILAGFPFPLHGTFYPLGFPLELATNSREVMEAASVGWGLFTQEFDEPPLRLSLGVLPGEPSDLSRTSSFRAREHLLVFVADAANFMVCDFNQSFAFGFITEPVA